MKGRVRIKRWRVYLSKVAAGFSLRFKILKKSESTQPEGCGYTLES
jgi:hypothetical protein